MATDRAGTVIRVHPDQRAELERIGAGMAAAEQRRSVTLAEVIGYLLALWRSATGVSNG